MAKREKSSNKNDIATRSWDARRSLLASSLDNYKKLILMGYDAHAPIFGAGAAPSTATLARIASCTERTVYNHRRELIEMGLLEVVCQRPGRPTEYRLNMTAILALGTPAAVADVNRHTPATDSGVTPERDSGAPETQVSDAKRHTPETQVSDAPETQVSDEGVALAETRARARDGDPAPRVALPEMPTITLPFSRAESWVEFWERAASSAGRVRIYFSGLDLHVDAYSATDETERRLIVWRDGPVPGPGGTLAQAMEAFNGDAESFWETLVPQIGIRLARDWQVGAAPIREGYPMRSREYFERRRE